MNYLFIVNDEIIKGRPDIFLYTGNIGTYNFRFKFNNMWDGLLKFAVFSAGETSYTAKIENNEVTVPSEILISAGSYSFGVFGTNGEDDIKRISSNLIEFEVQNGAYTNGQTPVIPTPDIWETVFANIIPTIKNGNWYLYNIELDDFVDTGIAAIPQKGIDYWTEEDRLSIVQDVVSAYTYGDGVSY